MTPDGRDAMVRHAAEFAELGIPFIFDPGQQLHLFGPDELARFLDEATWLTVNSYEWSQLQERSGLDAGRDRAAGWRRRSSPAGKRARRSSCTDARRRTFQRCAVPRAVDPTGCGDAYRAGLLLGLEAGRSIGRRRAGSPRSRVRSRSPILAARTTDSTRTSFAARFREAFGYSF